jgi:hypothetical protein
VVPVPPPPEDPIGAPEPPVLPDGALAPPVVPVPADAPPVVPVEPAPVVPVEPAPDELEEVVVLDVVLLAAATELVGTVNDGAPEVSVDPEPPPQPLRTPAVSAIARIPAAVLGLRARWLI